MLCFCNHVDCEVNWLKGRGNCVTLFPCPHVGADAEFIIWLLQLILQVYIRLPILYVVIPHLCFVVLSSIMLNHLSPLRFQSQTREASTISGVGSGVTMGRRDQPVSQEFSSLHPDVPPPSPPPPRLPPPIPTGQVHDAAAPSKNRQGKIGKGEQSIQQIHITFLNYSSILMILYSLQLI